jgi:hypothetical protein
MKLNSLRIPIDENKIRSISTLSSSKPKGAITLKESPADLAVGAPRAPMPDTIAKYLKQESDRTKPNGRCSSVAKLRRKGQRITL